MHHSPETNRWLRLVLLLGLLAAGCGGDRAKLVPAEGVLKINGQPAANVAIQFMSDVVKGNKGPTSVGTTDKEGKFRLKTNDGKDGAVPGPHNVVLTDLDEDRPAQGQVSRKPSRIPPQFT